MSQFGKNEKKELRVTLLILGALIAYMIIMFSFCFLVIGNRSSDWQYGAVSSIPAQTYSSTEMPPAMKQVPKQIELPAASTQGKKR